jgi:hypothetical protein
MTAKFGLLIDAKTKGENNIKRLGNSMQGVEGKAKNLGMAMRGVGSAFKALFAAAAVGGFASVIKGAIDTADSFQKLEVRTGIAAEKLMAYVEAGKLADVSQKQLEVGLKTLARTQVEAADGVKTYADAYAKLGIDVRNANGDLKPTDQLLGEIADRFADLPDGPEKAAAALDLFGKSGVDMITMLNGGSAALEEFNFGLSGEFAQNAAFYNDEVTKLGREFNKFKLQLVDALLPALTQITQSFATLFDEGTNLEPLFLVIGASIRVVAAAVFATIKLVDLLIKNAVAGFEIFGKLLRGDLGGAYEIFTTRIANVVEEAKANFAELGNILTGTATAPAGYTRKTSGSAFNLPGDQKSSTSNADKESARLAKEVTDYTLKRVGAFAQILQDLEQERRLLQAKLEGKEEEVALEMKIEEKTKGLPPLIAAAVEERIRGNAVLQDNIDAQEKANEAQKAQAEELNGLYKQIGSTILNNIGGAIQGVIDGTKSLKESLSDILMQIGTMLINFGTNKALSVIFNAKGNVFAKNKIVPFAYGGVVNKPTLFPMANGAGLMGEAGPEAIMPLRRGRDGRLGVEASGGVGNIVVNVDASGSNVEGDEGQSKALGQALGAAVKAEIIRQKMPGGLLS